MMQGERSTSPSPTWINFMFPTSAIFMKLIIMRIPMFEAVETDVAMFQPLQRKLLIDPEMVCAVRVSLPYIKLCFHI